MSNSSVTGKSWAVSAACTPPPSSKPCWLLPILTPALWAMDEIESSHIPHFSAPKTRRNGSSPALSCPAHVEAAKPPCCYRCPPCPDQSPAPWHRHSPQPAAAKSSCGEAALNIKAQIIVLRKHYCLRCQK